MENNFITLFLRYFMKDISNESIDLFTNVITYKEFPKNHILIKEKEKAETFFIIKRGIIGSFSKDINGEKEYIRAIHANNDVFTNISSLNQDNNTINNYVSLTDCEVYEGSFTQFIQYTNDSHEFAILYSRIIQKALLVAQMRIDELSLLDATDRYIILQKKIPNIENLIPQYQIANYLNITPVQLSRIRKKMHYK